MSVRSGQSIAVRFSTRRFDSGAATNADSTPTGTLYVNGTANGASVTVTNSATGKYKASVTLPTLTVNDLVELEITATVNSVTDSDIIWGDTKDVFAGAIPDAAANANGGLPVLSVSGTTLGYTVTTVTTNTDMRGTNNALLASGYTAPDNASSAAAAASAATAASNSAAIKTKTDQLIFTTANRVDSTAVTVSDKTGYALSATGMNLIVPADPSAKPVPGTSNIVAWIGYFGAWSVNEVDGTSGTVKLKNTAVSGNLATHTVSDDGTTFISGGAT